MERNSALWQNATTGVKTGWNYPFLPFQKTLRWLETVSSIFQDLEFDGSL